MIGTYRAAGVDRPLSQFGPRTKLGQRTAEFTIPADAKEGETIDFLQLPPDVRIIDAIVDVLDPTTAADLELSLELAAIPGGSKALEVPASGVLTGTTIGADDTVTIGSITYTFKTALSEPAEPYEVLLGQDDTESIENLVAAINGDEDARGTAYSGGTEAHPLVTAAAGDGDTAIITAKKGGLEGNAIEVSETLDDGGWDESTLTGGSGYVLVTADSIAQAGVLRRDTPGQPVLDDAYLVQGVLHGDDQEVDQRVAVTVIFEYTSVP